MRFAQLTVCNSENQFAPMKISRPAAATPQARLQPTSSVNAPRSAPVDAFGMTARTSGPINAGNPSGASSLLGVRAAAAIGKRGPLPQSSRICVVGAGPAGLTAASALKARGYDNVTVLEREPRVGGRCKTTERGNDMGAICHEPWEYADVLKLSDSLGVERAPAPRTTYYSTAAGGPVQFQNCLEKLRTASQATRFMFNHVFKWDGVNGPEITKVSPELTQSWSDLVDQKGYQDFAKAASIATVAFGYRSDVPALYNARYVSPKMIVGRGMGYWKGGTQQIWEKLVDRDKLDVRTGTQIREIDREDGVKVAITTPNGRNETLEFDKLIIACNPASMMNVLDATPAEQALYGQIETVDYRTYECEIDGLHDGEMCYGSFVDNLGDEKLDHPVLFGKRYPDKNQFIVYVNAKPGASDESIIEHIKRDMAKIGGELKSVTAAEQWEYFPHVSSDALNDGYYEKAAALQGQNNTCATGASYTFDILPHVMRHAGHIAGKLADNALPGTGVETIEREVQGTKREAA